MRKEIPGLLNPQWESIVNNRSCGHRHYGNECYKTPVFPQERQCDGKRRYDSELQATRAAHGLGKHKKGTRKVLHYLCPHCIYWHVGKMPTYMRMTIHTSD